MWSTISPPGSAIPTCRSTKARRSSATWRRRDYGRSHGVLHRHHGLHRVQSVRGRVQGMEPAPGRERRHPGAERRQLRQPPPAGRHPLAARPLHRAVQGPLRRPLVDDERRVQALRPGGMPGSVPDRRHHPHRVRHGGDPVRRLQRMSRVHRRLPVRRHRHQSGVWHGAEVHPLLRPAQGGARARVLEGVSHGLDPVRLDRRAADEGAEARRPAQVAGRQGGAVWRRPEGVARRAQFGLPAGCRTRCVRATAQAATAEPQTRQDRRLLGGERGRPWRLGPGRPAQAPDGRHGRAGSGGIELMSDTFFSGAPHWAWLIILYFFVGGIAGGACLLAAVVDWFGGPEDRPVVRTGYNVAAWGAILSAALLTIDLGRPLRFWHMLFQSANVPALMFKGWSPISFGAWALLLFGLFAVLSALGGMAEEGRLHNAALRAVGGAVRGGLAKVVGGVAGLLGVFIAGYTGILLSVTNRPIWADSPWLRALVVASGASTGAAALILLAPGRGATEQSLGRLSAFDTKALLVELLVLVLFLASLGSVNRVWIGFWGLVLLVGVVGLGILAPLRLHLQRRPLASAAKLVLLGGFLLRLATIFVSEGIEHYRVTAGM